MCALSNLCPFSDTLTSYPEAVDRDTCARPGRIPTRATGPTRPPTGSAGSPLLTSPALPLPAFPFLKDREAYPHSSLSRPIPFPVPPPAPSPPSAAPPPSAPPPRRRPLPDFPAALPPPPGASRLAVAWDLPPLCSPFGERLQRQDGYLVREARRRRQRRVIFGRQRESFF